MVEFNDAMMHESVWFDRVKYEEEVENYQSVINGVTAKPEAGGRQRQPSGSQGGRQRQPSGSKDGGRQRQASGSQEGGRQRQASGSQGGNKAAPSASNEAVKALEKENAALKKLVADLSNRMAQLEVRVQKVETAGPKPAAPAAAAVPKAAPAPAKKEDSDDDMFGDDDDDESDEEETPAEKAKREKMEKMKADAAKPKKVVIAKSEVTLDVKPWDDETDMIEMERLVRTIAMEGLIWSAGKLEPVGYGIFKLRIRCVVVDDLVSTEDIEDKIKAFEDHVQSVDIFAFNKI